MSSNGHRGPPAPARVVRNKEGFFVPVPENGSGPPSAGAVPIYSPRHSSHQASKARTSGSTSNASPRSIGEATAGLRPSDSASRMEPARPAPASHIIQSHRSRAQEPEGRQGWGRERERAREPPRDAMSRERDRERDPPRAAYARPADPQTRDPEPRRYPESHSRSLASRTSEDAYEALLQDLDRQFSISTSAKASRSSPSPSGGATPPLAMDQRIPPRNPERDRERERERERDKGTSVVAAREQVATSQEKSRLQLEMEAREQQESRREYERFKNQQLGAMQQEAQLVARERAKAQGGRLLSPTTGLPPLAPVSGSAASSLTSLRSPAGEASPTARSQPASTAVAPSEHLDERIIVPDYIKALRTVIKGDAESEITPEDFANMEGYTTWRSAVRASFHDVLSQLLKSRFLDPLVRKVEEPKKAEAPTTIFLKVAQAEGLTARESKARDAYCTIEYGVEEELRAARNSKRSKNQERFMTEIVKNTLNPIWDQHLKIPVWEERGHVLLVSVWDNQKEHFLGRVRIPYADIIRTCTQDGFLNRWFRLEPDEVNKEKHVGGELYLQMTVQQNKKDDIPTSSAERSVYFIKQLATCRVNLKSLYAILIRCTLALDMRASTQAIKENTAELYSPESRCLHQLYSREWSISPASRAILHLELLFNKFKAYEIPTGALLSAYEKIYDGMKSRETWLNPGERDILNVLLNHMNTYYISQIVKYKEFYPKNMPRGALETTILMLRMIHKNPIFRTSNPHVHQSFREELRGMMTTSSIDRFQRYKELSLPLDESDIEEALAGTLKLTELIMEDIEADSRYFKKPFARELDIEKLNAECLCKQLVTCFHEIAPMLSYPQVQGASKIVFDLYRAAVKFHAAYGRFLPVVSEEDGFVIEEWFGPFIFNWLNGLSTKTLEWVQSACKSDTFQGIVEPSKPTHSSSVTDIFSAIHAELDFIQALNWSDVEQYSQFYQAFAKTSHAAMEVYCSTVSAGEFDASVPTKAWGGLVTRNTLKKDIENTSCVKLCNISYAVYLLDELYKKMTSDGVIQKARALRSRREPPHLDKVCGTLVVQVVYGDQLKPITKLGLANPFVRLCVPEGTVVPPVQMVNRKEAPGIMGFAMRTATAEVVLRGSACELVRSGVLYDTLTPTWEESFETVLPPVDTLLLEVLSKNMLTENDALGSASIDVSRESKLFRKLMNHQTHDVLVELEPQGRVLLRLTLAGEVEDVDFWFRKARERLSRTRDDFLRALTLRTAPFAREVIVRAIRDQEAVPAPAKTFLSSFTGAVEMSNLTASGARIDEAMEAHEADLALATLTDYFNRNLEILCISLTPKMAQEVIRRIWDEIISIVEDALVPNVYGVVEKDRRPLNRRQCSMADWTLKLLKEFFHADGEGLGLAVHVLETRKFVEVTTLISIYAFEVGKLKREYELGLSSGREKEFVLKLLRLKLERDDAMGAEVREEFRRWIELQLERRRRK